MSDKSDTATIAMNQSIFLTFDLDWCSDFVLANLLNLLEREEVRATFFVTHDSPLLARLRANGKFELGIHPNFCPCLPNDREAQKDPQTVLTELLKIVPEASAVRSHSLMQSSRILDLFHELGLRRDCNHFIPWHTGIVLRPWMHWNGLMRVPYFWEDSVHWLYGWNWGVDEFLAPAGLKVFNFHPIHIYLNTEDAKRYRQSVPFQGNREQLEPYIYRHDRAGARVFLENLIRVAKSERRQFKTISEVVT